MVGKFLKKWWFLISAFAILSASVAAWGVRVDTQLDMEEKYMPRNEIMLRLDYIGIQHAETNRKLEVIMEEMGIEESANVQSAEQ